jgi:hemerythrin-like domain-containing protein
MLRRIAIRIARRSLAMEATDILSSEHRVIEQVIAALDVAADRIEARQPVRRDFFRDATRFLRDFADGYHHAKEEGVLFEAMAQGGMPLEQGPIAVMLYEHERARELTAGLHDAAHRWAGGDEDVADVVADYARDYAEHLTQHMFKEDHILFPMAAQAIAPKDQAFVLAEFRRVERMQAERGSRQSFIDLAAALCAEMEIDPATVPRREAMLPCHAR